MQGLPLEIVLLEIVGGGSGNSAAGGLSNGGAAPDIVVGSNAANYTVDRSRSVDFAQQTGTTADASSGLGYVTVTPLPAGTLFTETQSELDVMWTTYNVTVTINGTDFPVSFSVGDTQAVVIEKVPVGASLSASATIGVSASGGGSLGYSSLTAVTASPTTIQPGSNSITMWVQYPVECHVSSGLPADAAITGTAPTYYSNNTAAALPAATASFVDGSTGNTMYFTGWSLTDGGTPDITGTSIPPSMYKGKLSLYATWGECALSITGAGLPAAVDPVLEEGDALTLTAVPAGFPAGAAISYSWRVVPPLSGAAPATVSGSGAHATVHPVVGSGGSATVEVTATCGTLTASAQQNVTIMVGIPDFTIQITPPSSYSSAKSTATAKKYALTNLTDAFTFTPVPAAGKSFPAGTTFSWTVKAGTMPEYTGSGGTGGAFTATPTQLSLTAESIGRTSAAAMPITISCTASHTLASADKNGTPGSASAFLLYTLPDFTISAAPAAASYDSANCVTSDGVITAYALTSLTGTITIEAGGATFPAGTTFDWTVNGTALTGTTQHGSSLSMTLAAMGITASTISQSSTTPTEIPITCKAKHTDATESLGHDAPDATLKVFLLSHTVSFDTGTGGSVVADQIVVHNGTASKPAVDPMRTGCTFLGWYTGTVSGSTVTLDATAYDFTTAVTADLTLYAKWRGAVNMKTGPQINSLLTGSTLGANAAPNKTFSASSVPPVAGTTTVTLSASDSQTVVEAWLDTDGTSIKYYAEGYTDVSPVVKIPLNANSSEMFQFCNKLSSIDLSVFDTSNVTNMGSMFDNCTGLTSLDVSGFDTSKVTNMDNMFYKCSGVTSLDVSGFDTSNVTNIGGMFSECKALTSLDVSGFDTSKVTSMSSMFYHCDNLTSIDVSGFDTSNVTSMYSMFYHCEKVTAL